MDDGSNSLLLPFRNQARYSFYTYYSHLSLLFDSVYEMPPIRCFDNDHLNSNYNAVKFIDGRPLDKKTQYVILAGTDLSDESFLDQSTYLNCLSQIIIHFSSTYPEYSFAYYPHRRESRDKILTIDSIGNIKCLSAHGSIERFIATTTFDIRMLISFSSSLEVTLPRLCGSQIKILPARLPFQFIDSSYLFEYLIISSGLASSSFSLKDSQSIPGLIFDQYYRLQLPSAYVENELQNNQFILLSSIYPDHGLDPFSIQTPWSYHPFLLTSNSFYIWKPFLSSFHYFLNFSPELLAFYTGRV
jgi:hypothetical protein